MQAFGSKTAEIGKGLWGWIKKNTTGEEQNQPPVRNYVVEDIDSPKHNEPSQEQQKPE